MAVTTSALIELWNRRIDDGVDSVRADLETLGRTCRSRRSAADVAELLERLDGSRAEAAAWWQLICGWPWGFPPDPSRTPADRYPLDDA